MMKRIISTLTALLLCFLLLTSPVQSESVPYPMNVMQLGDWGEQLPPVRSQCAYQGKLALLTQGQGIQLYDPNTRELGLLLAEDKLPPVQWLIGDGATLWGYNLSSCMLYPLLSGEGLHAEPGVLGEPKLPGLQLTGATLEDLQSQDALPEQMLMADNVLYALFRPGNLGGYQTRLLAWQLPEGMPVDVLQPNHLQAIASYREGQLLGLVRDAWQAANSPDEALRRPQVIAFEPSTGHQQVLGSLSEPVEEHNLAFAWNPEDDSILYTSASRIFRRDAQGKESLCSYLNLDIFMEGVGDRLVALPGQLCAVLVMDQCKLHSTLPASVGKPLTIYGLMTRNRAHLTALESIPGTQVQYLERIWDEGTSLSLMLQSGAETADLLFLNSSWDETQRMVEKGYLLDLSQSQVLAGHVRRCYPFLQEQASYLGGIYLLPINIEAMVHVIQPQRFVALGLEPPRSFSDLCRFLTAWQVDEAKGMLPYLSHNPREEMLFLARRMALSDLAGRGEELRFDTPLMRSLLSQADELRLDDLIQPEGDFSWAHGVHLISMTNYNLPGFTHSGNENLEEETAPLLLSPGQDNPGTLPCQVGYLTISLKGANQQAALSYAEHYVASLEEEQYIALCPDENNPVQLPGTQQRIQRLQTREKELVQAIAQAEGATKSALEADLDTLRANLARQMEERYWISPKVISRYREDMAHAFVLNRQLVHLTSGHDFDLLFKRWQQGQLSLDGYLSEADNKLRLMRMEDQ